MTADFDYGIDFAPLPSSVSQLADAPEEWRDMYIAQPDGTYLLQDGVQEGRANGQAKAKTSIDKLLADSKALDRQKAEMEHHMKEDAINDRFDILLADFHMPPGLKRGMIALLRKEMSVKAHIVDTGGDVAVRVTYGRDDSELSRWQLDEVLRKPVFDAYRQFGPEGRKGAGKFTRELATIR